MKKLITLILFASPFFGVYAQIKPTLIVKVANGRDSTALAGATVQVAGAESYATDVKGIARILQTPPLRLTIRYVGFVSRSLTVIHSTSDTLQVFLQPEFSALKEVVVSTGYQTLPRERATGSFETVDHQLYNRARGTDVLTRLEGVTTGTLFDRRIQQDPLSALTIHGIGTLYANTSPLVVVDNFPYDGDINNLNPNDVAGVTLLKDAAAASIWGVQAGNGVIVITTKKGAYNQPLHVSLSSNVTFSNKPDLYYLPQMSSSAFIDVEEMLFKQGFYGDVLSNNYSFPTISPVVNLLNQAQQGQISQASADQQIDALRSHDMRQDYEKYLYREGVNQQYALSLDGGGPAANYYFSTGYDHNQYSPVNSGYERVTLKSNNTFRPLKRLEVQAGLQYTYSKASAENSLSPYGYGEIIPAGESALYPYAQLADSKGKPLPIARDYNPNFIDTAGNGKLLDWRYRPLQEAQLADNHTEGMDALANFGVRYNFDNHLTAAVKFQYERSGGTNKQYYSPDSYYTRNLINSYTQLSGDQVITPIPYGGILDLLENHYVSYDYRGQLDYNNAWGKSVLSAIAGFEVRQDNAWYEQGRTYGYNPGDLTFAYTDQVNYYPSYDGIYGDQVIPGATAFGSTLNRNVSYYMNAGYTYDRRYVLSISARKDESNLFGVNTNQKGVPLWSSGLAWNVSDEAFYHWAALPRLKLRLTYGYSGNVYNQLSAYTTISYVPNNFYTQLPYANILNPPNADLRWEKTGTVNLGLDFALAGGRLSGTADFYIKNSHDLISPVPVDFTTGFSYLTINAAGVRGTGADVTLESKNLTGQVSWNTALLFSYNRSIVTQYYENPTFGSSYVNTTIGINPTEGKDVEGLYSYRWAGLNPQNGNPRGDVNGQVSEDYESILNGSLRSLHYDGPQMPVYFGALRNTFTYRHFSLSANIQYKFDYYFRKASINYTNLFSGWAGNSDYDLRWQKPGDEQHTAVPSLIYPADPNRDQFYTYSQATVARADNIRLQDLRLGYNPDPRTARWLRAFRNLEVFAYASNLGLLWRANKWGVDPDYGTGIPAPFSLSLGVNAGF